MSAQSKPERNPDEHAEIFIAEYQQKFSIAIDAARAAAQTTGTAAWRENYLTQRKIHRDMIAASIKAIGAEVESVTSGDTTEDAEKGIKDAVKAMADERIRFEAWKARAVRPYKIAAENADDLRSKTVREARRSEGENPLIDRGLGEAVAKLVARWPTVAWDDEAGVVTVNEPAGV